MTKILALFLMVIVSVAAFTPCCTIDGCQDEITATSQPDHWKGDDGSGCSPFFACTGCPGFTLMEKPVILPVPAEYHPQYFEEEINFLSSTYAFSPWQPPRVA